jgi:hypothetical protein
MRKRKYIKNVDFEKLLQKLEKEFKIIKNSND